MNQSAASPSPTAAGHIRDDLRTISRSSPEEETPAGKCHSGCSVNPPRRQFHCPTTVNLSNTLIGMLTSLSETVFRAQQRLHGILSAFPASRQTIQMLTFTTLKLPNLPRSKSSPPQKPHNRKKRRRTLTSSHGTLLTRKRTLATGPSVIDGPSPFSSQVTPSSVLWHHP